jgi:hypothetical protein
MILTVAKFTGNWTVADSQIDGWKETDRGTATNRPQKKKETKKMPTVPYSTIFVSGTGQKGEERKRPLLNLTTFCTDVFLSYRFKNILN